MKNLFFALLAILFLGACNNGGAGGGVALPMNSQVDSVSYAFGINVAQTMEKIGEDSDGKFKINVDLLKNGIAEGTAGNSRLKDEEIDAVLRAMSMEVQQLQAKKKEAEAAGNIEAGQTYLAANATKEGVKTTDSGLQYKVITEGSGSSPSATDRVKVHYTGKLIDGTVFDSSVQRGTPATFGVGQVIPGWIEGLQMMKPGAKYEFTIPANLGYGPRGTPSIPGNSVLIFDVELIEIVTQ